MGLCTGQSTVFSWAASCSLTCVCFRAVAAIQFGFAGVAVAPCAIPVTPLGVGIFPQGVNINPIGAYITPIGVNIQPQASLFRLLSCP